MFGSASGRSQCNSWKLVQGFGFPHIKQFQHAFANIQEYALFFMKQLQVSKLKRFLVACVK